MANLRKLLFALTVILVATVTASAQTVPPFQCTASAVPNSIRAEGIAELVGDLVLTCRDGLATPTGQTVPRVNIQIATPIGVNITSKLLSNGGSEALLLIDDPEKAEQNPCPNLTGCSHSGVATTPNSTGLPYKTGKTSGVYNVYQAQKAADHSLVWLGVPLDPPGTTTARVLRIKNVRVNASALGATGIWLPLTMSVSISGETSLPVNNSQQVVAYVQPGVTVEWRNACSTGTLGSAGASFLQCTSTNSDLYGDPGKGFNKVAFRIKFTEGFASSFKKRNWGTSDSDPTNEVDQASPVGVAPPPTGQLYNTETGFYNPDFPIAALKEAGRANHGTRFRVVFSDVPADVKVFASVRRVAAATDDPVIVHLVSTDSNGAGNYLAPSTVSLAGYDGSCSATTFQVAPVTISGGTGVAVWEVVETNPLALGWFEVAVVIAYKANTAAGLPGLGTMKASASFAPISTTFTMSSSAPVPRFVESPAAPRNVVVINPCTTNLLFPFVTNQAGFDTGIAIANTSKDPFGTSTQSGACTLNYYGQTAGGGAPPAAQTSGVIAAGDTAVFTLSAGGTHGITATPGFQGYIIAQCRFQYAHGFAFVSDLGAAKLSHGYVALVMDSALGSRTGFSSEVLGQ